MRNISILLPFLFLLLASCQFAEKRNTKIDEAWSSINQTSFKLDLFHKESLHKMLNDSLLFGSKCRVSVKEIGDRYALEIKTIDEFCDAFIHLYRLSGHSYDFTQARYLSMSLYVPHDSWISTMKLNFKDSSENFGGCAEVFNNFYGNTDTWLNFVVDLQDILPKR